MTPIHQNNLGTEFFIKKSDAEFYQCFSNENVLTCKHR